MDINRVKEIIDSPQIIDVFYQNTTVWIEGIENNSQAQVRLLNSDVVKIVPLKELFEP